MTPDSPRLKIIHVAETIRGGIATYFTELHALQCQTFGKENVCYIVPSDHRADLIGIANSNIVAFDRSGRNLPSLMRLALETMRQVQVAKPDIVHVHSTLAGLIVRTAFVFMRNRPAIVYCSHGWAFSRETSRFSNAVAKVAERLLAKVTDKIICISQNEYSAARDAGIPEKKLSLVLSGMRNERPNFSRDDASWNTSKLKVLFIGRLDRQKGYDFLIEAARQLETSIDVRMIGSAVVNEEGDHTMPSNVTLLGWLARTDIEAQLDLTDIAVIPSRWEAFGFVALEAMRAHKPILAFRAGALPEIIEDGLTGLICDPAGTQALVAGLRRASQVNLRALGEAGYDRFVSMFRIERTHQELLKVYALVVTTSPRHLSKFVF
ncbi:MULTISPECIES: glycosyltransferase [Bradyrhizobium]|uniref:glycosyltransferase n=1 Tax=Bradyrhizobium TaxID=374 RepID=UPI001B8A5667|nr:MULTISPECIES: glycosyltransferase [Bradyrhizobium]MBR0969953.1 glycosyltransferase [Bradyrhizobium japonicum]